MASFEIRQTSTACSLTAALLLLIAGALPGTGLAQSEFAPKNERQQQLIDAIQQEQSRNGSYSAALIEPWTALAVLYDEDGSSELAIGAIEHARQVLRANYGLRSMKEAPLMRQEMHIAAARGDAEGAWELEQDLLTLIRRHPDDLTAVPILAEIAAERLDLLRRYRAGELPIQIVLGCYYERPARSQSGPIVSPGQWDAPIPPSGSCSAGSSKRVMQALVDEAKLYYSEAIGVLDRNRRYSSDELQNLEAQLIRTSYSSWDYLVGKQSYRRLVSYDAANSAPWPDRIATFLESTDWDLLFAQHEGTQVLDGIIEEYEQAYGLLERKNADQASIDQLFSPKIPVVLPSFLPNPLDTKPSGSGGYVDVAFDIGKYGRAAHVAILGATADATGPEKKELVRLIRRRLFRPQVTNGRIVDDARVVVRYYLPR